MRSVYGVFTGQKYNPHIRFVSLNEDATSMRLSPISLTRSLRQLVILVKCIHCGIPASSQVLENGRVPFVTESEVARILQQISAEYEAAERGLKGLSLGAARHDFMIARTEHIGQLHIRLRKLVGDDAMKLIAKQLDKPSE